VDECKPLPVRQHQRAERLGVNDLHRLERALPAMKHLLHLATRGGGDFGLLAKRLERMHETDGRSVKAAA
jgi:hypothetical protein